MIARLLEGVPRRGLVLLAVLLAGADRRAAGRQRLPAHRPDPDSLFRLCRPGLEHHDGLCRPALARPRALCRARRLYGGGALRAFRHRPVDRAARPRSPVAVACGAVIGFLAFRFGVAGVYFAILTIAFAEFARIGFDHFSWVGGSAGLLPAGRATTRRNDLWNLRGKPTMFYYVILALTVAGLRALPCAAARAASAISGWRSARTSRPRARSASTPSATRCIAVVISAGMTSLAGVFFAFYYNNLFPEQVFHISRSIELILGADHRRHRHAVRPDPRRVPAHRPVGDAAGAAHAARHRHARRQAGVLRRLPAGGRDGRCRTASGRRLRGCCASACAERRS